MNNNSAKEGFGVVQLGDVTAYGQWKMHVDGYLEISLGRQSLSLEKQRGIENSSTPIQVQIPGDRAPVMGSVIVFQCDDHAATFQVLRQGQEKPTLELRGRRSAMLPATVPESSIPSPLTDSPRTTSGFSAGSVRLRSLMLAAIFLPPLIAGGWRIGEQWRAVRPPPETGVTVSAAALRAQR